jgi:hypothetical protein
MFERKREPAVPINWNGWNRWNDWNESVAALAIPIEADDLDSFQRK